MLGSGTAESAAGTPTTDFGLKSPTKEREPFFIPLPIFLIMTDAEEAVDDIERLSVDPVKK